MKGKFKRDIPEPLFVNRDAEIAEEPAVAPKVIKTMSRLQPESEMPSDVRRKTVRPSSAPFRRIKQVEASNLIKMSSPKSQTKKNDMIEKRPKVIDENSASPVNYTYDLNGRKVILSDAEMELIKRRHMKALEGATEDVAELLNRNAKMSRREQMMEDILNSKPISSSLAQPTPTVAAWPSARTEKSAEEYVKKQLEARNLEHNVAKECVQPKPRMFGAYEKMENLDLIFSIEYCHNCEFHNISLRHKPQEYIDHADVFLRLLAKLSHEYRICARVGVIRLEATITPKSRQTDVDNRIGAFEIQVAYRNKSGVLHPELLHSKLSRRNWPSKSVMEKRLQSFFNRMKTDRIDSTVDLDNAEYSETASLGLAKYPVGFGPWASTALSLDTWKYPGTVIQDQNSQGNSDDKIPNIQWVYDSRNVLQVPKFSVGSTVWVSDTINPKGIRERHPLLGVILGFAQGSSPRSGKVIARQLSVKLNYENIEIDVSEELCTAFSEGDNSSKATLAPTNMKIALELAVVIQSASRLGRLDWFSQGAEDNVVRDVMNGTENLHLCRSSFFKQVRTLAAEVESEFKAKGGYKVLHEGSNTWVDAQLAYSEVSLDKALELFGGKSVDTNLLNDLVLGKLSAREVATDPLPPQHPESRPSSARSGTFSSHNLRYAEELGEINSSLYMSPIVSTPVDNGSQPNSGRLGSRNNATIESPFPFLSENKSFDAFDISPEKLPTDEEITLAPVPNLVLSSREESSGSRSLVAATKSELLNDLPPSGTIFADKNITFSVVELEGQILKNPSFDSTFLIVNFVFLLGFQTFASLQSEVSNSREERLPKRIFPMKGSQLDISAISFEHDALTVLICSTGDTEGSSNVLLEGSVRLYKFLHSENSCAEVEFVASSSDAKRTVSVKISAICNDSISSKASRIESMNPEDLAALEIDPSPTDNNHDNDDDADDGNYTQHANDDSPVLTRTDSRSIPISRLNESGEENDGSLLLDLTRSRVFSGDAADQSLLFDNDDDPLDDLDLGGAEDDESPLADYKPPIPMNDDRSEYYAPPIQNFANLQFERPTSAARPISAARPGSAARSSRNVTPREASQELIDDLNNELNGEGGDDDYDENEFEEV